MSRKSLLRLALSAVLLIVTLVLSACIPPAPVDQGATSAETPAATSVAATTSVTTTQSTTATQSAAPPGNTNAVYELPDLKGRSVIAVAANDFTPFDYVDPQTGKAVGMEYDLVNEACRRLNCKVDWKTSAWDGMIAAVHG